MNRVDQPTADDVILDLLIDGVEPTHENLVVAIAAYPQHRDALVAFFANLAVQTALKDEPAPSGCSVEQFANIGVSRVLVRRHEAQGQTSTDIDDTSGEIEIKSMPPRLSQLIRARGLTEDEVAVRLRVMSILGRRIKKVNVQRYEPSAEGSPERAAEAV